MSPVGAVRSTLPLLACGICLNSGLGCRLPGAFAAPTLATKEAKIETLLAKMTLEEKIGQLTQVAGTTSADGTTTIDEKYREPVRKGAVGSILSAEGAALTRDWQRLAVEESRLGIPLVFAFDVIHGFRTTFPIPLAEVASWDPAAVEQAARVAAVEAAAAGLHWTFAPMVDIARDPRWGRIAEGAGEDPYLGSIMAAARVRGFQGKTLSEPDALLACAKHFVGYGGAEGGRDYNSVDVSERSLHELYLPPFRAALTAGARTVMTAFNDLGGVPMTANEPLTQGLLRRAWGFDGIVVSDWESVRELMTHGLAGSQAEAAGLALAAGVDIDMASGIYAAELPGLVRQGIISQAAVDAAVRRVLMAKEALGLFDDPYRHNDLERERRVMLSVEHRATAREIARRSIVLLKNDRQTLPFAKSLHRVAVVGALADDRGAALGPWSAPGRPEDVVSVLDGIRQALGPEVVVESALGCPVNDPKTDGIAAAVRLAERADAVVLVLGEGADMSGEAASRSTLELPGAQGQLADAVLAVHKPTVVVLMNGRPLAIPSIAEKAPAILETWFLGVETGHAVSDVLFGDFNPGGRLPVSFPRATGQVPTYYNHKNTGRPGDVRIKETSKYIDLPLGPLYPFGHGLSYTQFEYRDLKISPAQARAGETVSIEFAITNTGQRAGDEVVQLYVHDPVASVTRPVKQLKGFGRITLAPGVTKRVTMELPIDGVGLYDRAMTYLVEPGRVEIMIGASSADIRLEGTLEIVGSATHRDDPGVPLNRVTVSPASTCIQPCQG